MVVKKKNKMARIRRLLEIASNNYNAFPDLESYFFTAKRSILKVG